jgi:hypothetical protein
MGCQQAELCLQNCAFSMRHEPTTANPMPPRRGGGPGPSAVAHGRRHAGPDPRVGGRAITRRRHERVLRGDAGALGGVGGVRDRRARAARAGGRGRRLRLLFQAANTAVRAAVSCDPLFVNTAVSLLHSSLTSVSGADSLYFLPKTYTFGSLAFCCSRRCICRLHETMPPCGWFGSDIRSAQRSLHF